MATIKQTKEGTWQVAIRRRGAKPVYKTFLKKAQAQQWARETEAAMDTGAFEDFRKAEKTLLGDMLSRYQEEITPTKKSQRTERASIANLQAGLPHYVLAAVTPRVVVAYAERRLAVVGSDTVRRELQILSEVFATARALWSITCINPVPEARQMLTRRRMLQPGVRRERRLLRGEQERLLAVKHKRLATPTQITEVIGFLLETALRRGELAAMKRADINKAACTLRIPESKTDHQTGEKGRTIPLSQRAMQILQSLPARIDGSVWIYTDVDAISRAFSRTLGMARRAYVAECEAAGMEPEPGYLEGLRLHDLRHEATSRLFERGLSLPEVASITGHADWDSLKRYTHPQAEQIAKKLKS